MTARGRREGEDRKAQPEAAAASRARPPAGARFRPARLAQLTPLTQLTQPARPAASRGPRGPV